MKEKYIPEGIFYTILMIAFMYYSIWVKDINYQIYFGTLLIITVLLFTKNINIK